MKWTGLDELGHSIQGKSLRLTSLQQSWEWCPQPTPWPTRWLPLLAGCPRSHVTALTFVVVPDPHFAEVSQAQHVGEVEFVHLVPLKLVGLVGLLQGKDPAVPILPKQDQEHVGIRACSWKTEQGTSSQAVLPTDVWKGRHQRQPGAGCSESGVSLGTARKFQWVSAAS